MTTTTTTTITTVSRPNNHQRRKKAATPLIKQKSWSPAEMHGDELWERRKKQSESRQRSKSLTDEDVEELKACIELGFSFDSPELQPHSKLSQTIPALDFYLTVNRTYNDSILKSQKSSSSLSSSDSDVSPSETSLTFFTPGEDPMTIKTRLRHWAQMVACSVKQAC